MFERDRCEMPDLRSGEQIARYGRNRRLDGVREMRQRRSDPEVCEDQEGPVLSDERLSGARPAFAQIMEREYGDAGGLDDLLLVLPEL